MQCRFAAKIDDIYYNVLYLLNFGERKKSRPCSGQLFGFGFSLNYSALGASTGQASAQAPHSMQASASITYLPSPSEIASTGHSAAQAPHEMQASSIMYAIEVLPPYINFKFIVTHYFKNARAFLRKSALNILKCFNFCFINFDSGITHKLNLFAVKGFGRCIGVVVKLNF